MAKTLDTLLSKLSPEARMRAQARADQMLSELPPHEPRKARKLSQQTVRRPK